MNRHFRSTRLRLLQIRFFDLVGWSVLGAGGTVGLAAGLGAIELNGPWGNGFFLAWLLVATGFLSAKLIRLVFTSGSRKRVLRLIESVHPEYANRLSTWDYLSSHPEEIDLLGYSKDLVQALKDDLDRLPTPSWDRMGLSWKSQRPALWALGVGLFLIAASVLLFPGVTKEALEYRFLGQPPRRLVESTLVRLPETLRVPIHREIILPAPSPSAFSLVSWRDLPPERDVEFLVREGIGPWRILGIVRKPDPTAADENATSPRAPLRLRVEGEIEICARVNGTLSSVCRIEPVFPPTVEEFVAAIKPPDYTRRPVRFLRNPRVIEALRGSEIGLSWKADNSLESATLELLSETRSILVQVRPPVRDENSIEWKSELTRGGSLLLFLEDRFGQTGTADEVNLVPLEDRVPVVEILSPTRETILPQSLQVPIRVLVTDDIALAEVSLVYRVSPGTPGAPPFKRLISRFVASVTVESVTAQVLSTLLDLGEAGLWPGDEVSYWIEATDWRGEKPGRSGRSATYHIRYPSVEEELEEVASMRTKTTDGIEELLEDQKEISRQFREIRQDIQRNLSDPSDPDQKWRRQKKLAETIRRQQEVREQLAELTDEFEESLKRLSEENDLTLRTLMKFERVQELLDQVLSEESKQILRDLQETLRRLQDGEVRPEDMENTEMNLAEFEKQLDRQLALLENLWLEQELESLEKRAEELADRQNELLEETMEKLLTEEERRSLEAGEAEPEIKSLADAEQALEILAEELADEMIRQASGESSDDTLSDDGGEESPDQEGETSSSGSEKEEQEAEEESTERGSEKNGSDQSDKPSPSEGSEGDPDSQSDTSTQGAENAEKSSQPSGLQQTPESPDEADSNGLENRNELPSDEEILAERQERLNEETRQLLEDLKRLREKAEEQNHPSTDDLEAVAKSPQAGTLPQDQKSALFNLQEKRPRQAARKQSSASKKLAEMAQVLSAASSGSRKNLEDSIAKMREILDRAFILSEESEKSDLELARYKPLATWPNIDRMSRLGRRMNLYKQEAHRLSSEFRQLSESNPFADFEVVRRFDRAVRLWEENTAVMEESSPLMVSVRSHQSLAQVNLAIEELIDSIQKTQSRCNASSGGLEGYFKGLKKVLAEQKKLNQQTKDLMQQQQNQEGTPQSKGGIREKLRKLAQQQQNTRRMLEELEKRYRQMKQKAGNLGAVGEDMENVERELEQGTVDDRVVELQERIEQRLLDAEKSLHEQGFRKKRRALHAEGEGPDPLPEEPIPLLSEDEESSLARLLQQNLESVSPHWRRRVRAYYDQLLQMTP